ncbi:DUF4105 domain-containing protein [Polaribacter aestuariivivens]|uniref:DUF4105 domain-containing protein n=1 Tax=Polaribacter aestuariivivens TaxID=2304626 RepID=A0A5S3N8L2_9FLAO|nr:DUF4105 domain-containing protein [Polaribacter aestuariivivens]TMM31332.1 DUF4105 domain-containing protein [Polaribacter aestuariivivens]
MNKKLLLLFLFFATCYNIQSQVKLSVYSEISIVTAGPGNELYEKFGHSAIRIKDPVLNLDIIYNYGIFDFDAPNFYTNFAQGKMYYLLARYDFKYFLASYKKDKRWLKQQVLNLNIDEKRDFFNYLENNAKPANATYLYDPFFNNCSTKLKDITKSILKNKVVFDVSNIENGKTLRELMNQEIYWNTWGNFGINLIAGTILDFERNQLEYTYLPDYLHKVFENGKTTRNNGHVNLVVREDVLLNFEEKAISNSTIFSPLNVFILLLFIVIFITFKDFKNRKRTKSLDFLIFFITGFVGLILTYLWFFSSHKTAPNNFNILWAFLPNIFVAFLLLKNKAKIWIRTYILALLLFLVVILILWVLKVQIFPIAIIPLLMLLFVRYCYLYYSLLPSIK